MVYALRAPAILRSSKSRSNQASRMTLSGELRVARHTSLITMQRGTYSWVFGFRGHFDMHIKKPHTSLCEALNSKMRSRRSQLWRPVVFPATGDTWHSTLDIAYLLLSILNRAQCSVLFWAWIPFVLIDVISNRTAVALNCSLFVHVDSPSAKCEN